MNPLLPAGTQPTPSHYLADHAGSYPENAKTKVNPEPSEGIPFGRSGTCDDVRFGSSKALAKDTDAEKTSSLSGSEKGISITDLLESILALVLKYLDKQASDEEASDAPMQFAAKSAITPDAFPDASNPPRPTPMATRQPVTQPDTQSDAGNPLGNNVKSTAGTNGASAADPNEPPKGMPKDLWKDCINACDRQGGDPFILAAQLKQETQWGTDHTNAPDGVAQVEASTRDAYAGKFRESTGRDYDHSSQSDQVELAQLIKVSKGGDERNELMKYNGGDNWAPGATDSLGRTIEADTYADKVLASADDLRHSAS
jgi:hypothetical protein